jgi:hypothetical protein
VVRIYSEVIHLTFNILLNHTPLGLHTAVEAVPDIDNLVSTALFSSTLQEIWQNIAFSVLHLSGEIPYS